MQRFAARYIWGGALVAVVVTTASMLLASRDGAPREIRLVARDMTFYLDGQDEPNPTLKLHAGEQVRVTLRNDDVGLTHDFAIRAWDVGTPLVEGQDKEGSVVFRVPGTPGTQEYTCTPHSAMMRGTIAVESRAEGS